MRVCIVGASGELGRYMVGHALGSPSSIRSRPPRGRSGSPARPFRRRDAAHRAAGGLRRGEVGVLGTGAAAHRPRSL